jgi:hypothetical protein
MTSLSSPRSWQVLVETEELRDVSTRLLVQRVGVVALLTAAALVWLADLTPTGPILLQLVVGTGGAIGAALAFPGAAEVANRAAIYWSTRHYPLEGAES